MKRLLAAVNPAMPREAALARACRLAAEHGAHLHLLGVIARDGTTRDHAAALQRLRMTLHRSAMPDQTDAQCDILEGDPPTAIAQTAHDIGADLIVLGAHRHPRLSDRVFGTTAEALLRDTHIPLLIARGLADRPYRRAIAAAQSDSSITTAIALASMIGIEMLTAVHAYELPFEAQVIGGSVTTAIMAEEAQAFAERVKRLAAETTADLRVDALSIEDEVVFALEEGGRATRADLLILTTHARSGLAWLTRGSVTDAAIERLPGDMLIGRLSRH
ncbi:universal stress protein [Hephaestia mangrovi]|uniref:universal stress protein n=1 Tax=Hephaestia mangrovi TaxID=2873268 RepID=UPI001CA778C5|nr:universal stress protein [Hephaestia mangrovi]MBY8829837.1 universal stress protein [Hephaestia mangrovi]